MRQGPLWPASYHVRNEPERCKNVTESTTTSDTDDADRASWATKINAEWQSSRDCIIRTGLLLHAAKNALLHGQWLALLDSDLHFKPRTAQRLMAIAEDPRITDTTHAPHLPACWTTLYVITKLSDHWFQVGLRCKAIRPDMERADAEDLLYRQNFGKRAKRDPDMAPSSNPNPLDAARKTYVVEGRKLTPQDRMRELARLASLFLVTDEEQIATRQRRRENAEETDFLIAQSFAEVRQGVGREQEGNPS